MTDEELMSHYDEIEDFICSEMADEEYYYQQEQEYAAALYVEWCWYTQARTMGWE